MRVSVSKGSEAFGTAIKALDLIKEDIKSSLEKKKPGVVLVKPNLLISDKNRAANTDVNVVRAVIACLNRLGDFRIIVGEGTTTAFGQTSDSFRENGYLGLEKEFGNVRIRDLNLDRVGRTFKGKTFRGEGDYGLYETAVKADYVISVAKMKTHNNVIATLSLKNMLGCVTNSHRHAMHGGFDPGFVKLDDESFKEGAVMLNYNLVKLSKAVYPDLAVIDGMTAMEGNGPAVGDPVSMNLIIASTDPLSADLTAVRVMGEDPNNTAYLRFLREEMKPEVEVVGEGVDSVKRKFRMHERYKDMLINYKDLLRLMGD
jgi:uncharacterized protein (DUF362 family)